MHKALFDKSDLPPVFLLKQGFDETPTSRGMAVYASQAMGLFGTSTAIGQTQKGFQIL